MASKHPDVLPVLKSWLAASNHKIESFWVGADWGHWARYELFMALEKELGTDCLVTHGNSELWANENEEVDILVEPRDGNEGTVAIKLRCEKVSENEGSYERFRDQVDADMEWIKSRGDIDGSFEGAKLFLIGFSGQPSAEDAEFKTQPQPEHFAEGEVHCWVVRCDL